MTEAPPSGWVIDELGAWRRETVHSMLRRLRGWDYRQRAIYQITITLEDRASRALGRLEVRRKGEGRVAGEWLAVEAAKGLALKPDEIEARVVASELGRAVERCWEAIALFYPQVKIIGKQLMPDHFHGLLFVTSPLECHLGRVIKGFKIGCNQAARALGVLCSATMSPRTERHPATTPTAKTLTAKTLTVTTTTPPATPSDVRQGEDKGLWAAGFQDTVLLREGQLANMSNYLADNPRRLAIKRLFPEWFRVAHELVVALPGGKGRFSALGNRFLLQRPLAQIQVSRRYFAYKRVYVPGGGKKIARDERGEPMVEVTSPEFAARRDELFAAAQHGAVLISPCVSDGERQLAREALRAKLPLITLQNKGFSPLQKPVGRYFDACGEGRLLMLSPAAWPYQPGEKLMTREDATAMNRLCQWLVGDNAAEINYHGLRPANIDAMAREAVNFIGAHNCDATCE